MSTEDVPSAEDLGVIDVSAGGGKMFFNIASQTPHGPETKSLTFKPFVLSPSEECKCDKSWLPGMLKLLEEGNRAAHDLDTQRELDPSSTLRRDIILQLPQIAGNERSPACCIPRYVKRENIGEADVKATLFACSTIHGIDAIFGCKLQDLVEATGMNRSTVNSRMKRICDELKVNKRCAFPKSGNSIIVSIDMLPELVRPAEDISYGTVDFIVNAAAYYEKHYVWNKTLDLNTVRFVILKVKQRCALTSFSHSFQLILRDQKYQHDLYAAMERRVSKLQTQLEEGRRNERILEGHVRNLMASFGALTARLGDHADLIDVILHRVDSARGSTEYLAKSMPVTSRAQQSREFAMELHEIFENGAIPEYKPQERDVAFNKALTELQETDQDADLKEGLDFSTDDEWILSHPKGSRSKCYQHNNDKIATALGRSPIPISVSEGLFFQMSDEQTLKAQEDEESRKRARDEDDSDDEDEYEYDSDLDSDEEPPRKRFRTFGLSGSDSE